MKGHAQNAAIHRISKFAGLEVTNQSKTNLAHDACVPSAALLHWRLYKLPASALPMPWQSDPPQRLGGPGAAYLKLEEFDSVPHADRDGAAIHEEGDCCIELLREVSRHDFAFRCCVVLQVGPKGFQVNELILMSKVTMEASSWHLASQIRRVPSH